MNPILAIAGKEIRDGMRNRWVAGTTLLLAGLALTLAFLGTGPVGEVKAGPLDATIVSLSSLNIFLVPLIALLLSHDAIIGELERGTMGLLLAYPVARWQVVIGKFLGHLAILVIATVLGFGAAGGAVALSGSAADLEAWRAFAAMIGASVLLGAVFVALGYLASATARERATAAGAAIGIWLFFVLIYDLALLGLLVIDQGRRVTVGLLDGLLLLNPADAYRLLNLTGFSSVGAFSGMAAVAQDARLAPALLVAALLGWVALPLGLAVALFARRPV